ncbi:MAG: type III-B CRISPR-associated protein Cas10/Cmr2 [Ignavibacteria bacterium]|jgi:CRISPR-associated protein Cmr2
MSNTKTLIGFNIGPIYEVMQHSKKTRELWFGSYLFSMLVRMVYDNLNDKGYSFIKPFYEQVNEEKSTTGLFPDRIVATSSKERDIVLQELTEIAKKIKSDFIKIINDLIESEKTKKIKNNSVDEIVNNYLQLDFVVLDPGATEDKDFVRTAESYLDAVEKNRSFELGKNSPTCYRCKSLPAVVEVYEKHDETQKDQKLCPFCFVKLRSHYSIEIQNRTGVTKNKPFPSLIEIAAAELKERHSKIFDKLLENDEEDIFNDTTIKKEVKEYHKYFALFMADGDNLSKVAKNLESPEELSRYLFAFGKKVHGIAQDEFKGHPIYIGGDDIFAIMPLAYKSTDGLKTVLDFANRINKEYQKEVSLKITGSNNPADGKTSVSIGVVAAYYKFPLAFALEEVQTQLFDVAKQAPGKNALAVRFIQHSGAVSDFKLKFDDSTLEPFNNLFRSVLSSKEGFPSVNHKIAKYKSLLSNLRYVYQLDNLLEKRFYEGFENEEHRLNFENLIKASLIKLLRSDEAEKALDNVSKMIHVLKFIKGEK